MCRLAAYLGTEIPLENIIAKPRHSLLVQSLDAQEAKLRVNGDGFGIAWYGHAAEPGLFKDVLPAWADTNLQSICRLVTSRLFLAHVRAATTGATSRDNCHPFAHGRWAFMHNGNIGDFARIRREMEMLINEDFYALRRGTTDSELFFLLLLTNGLEENPRAALDLTLSQVLDIAARRTTGEKPIRLTCVFTEGTELSRSAMPTMRRLPRSISPNASTMAAAPLPRSRWRAPVRAGVRWNRGICTVCLQPAWSKRLWRCP
ncbi:class II glutamine amidotransferase [Pannonibacter sp. Pt2-lr]